MSIVLGHLFVEICYSNPKTSTGSSLHTGGFFDPSHLRHSSPQVGEAEALQPLTAVGMLSPLSTISFALNPI